MQYKNYISETNFEIERFVFNQPKKQYSYLLK